MDTVTLHVNAGAGYDVAIGSGLLANAGSLIADACGVHAAAIITDDTVASLHLPTVEASLRAAGFAVSSFAFPHGEEHKTLDTLSTVLDFLADQQLTRSDLVVALGGGVVGDLAGFAAATFMRGIRCVQIPTTLLAAVDSSVGGKTAVDAPQGKNLIGAFHQPAAVICDIDCLGTLPSGVFADGMAEALKCGILCDPDLFDLAATARREDLVEIIARSIAIKRFFVEADETELGPRRYLNLGHTIGHAVETCSDFSISHGSAVAIGLVMIARACEVSGDAKPGTCARIETACTGLGLPTESPFSPSQLRHAALTDKKRSGDALTIVGIAEIGECYLEIVPDNDVERIARIGTRHAAVA